VASPQTPAVQDGGQGIVIVNNTQFLLTFADQFFDSGEFAVAPSSIPPFSSGTFTVVPKAGFAGVTGAVTFTFEPLPNVQCRLGAGFGNPFVGSPDSNVAFDADHNQPNSSNPVLNPIGLFTQGTYNFNSTSPSQNSSVQFTGTDTNGYPTTIQITGNATPGFVANITVTQIIVSGGE
jgi:hypothetical protein